MAWKEKRDYEKESVIIKEREREREREWNWYRKKTLVVNLKVRQTQIFKKQKI